MDLDDDEFVFCSKDFHEPILSNELRFAESEIPGDFDVLSNFLVSTQTKQFLSEEECVPELNFADLIPAERPDKSIPHLLADGNRSPSNEKKDQAARNMLEGLPGHTTAKLLPQNNANVMPSTNDIISQNPQRSAGQLPRENSSRLRMASAPPLPLKGQERHWGKGSLPGSELELLLRDPHPISGDRQQENIPRSVGHSEIVSPRQNLPHMRHVEQKNSFDEKFTEQLMYIQLSEIPSLPEKDSGHRHDMRMDSDMEEVLAQIDLTRVPSGNSGDSVGREHTKPIEDASQPRLRYSEGASASHYCHICGRASNTAQLAACANVRIGLCRKTLCEKCLLLHQRNLFHWAKAKDTTWTCTHCRGVCPKRARCHQYQRNNMRRRLKNTKGTSDETKETLKVEKKPIAKTPTARKAHASQAQSNTPRAPEAPHSVFNKIPVQFNTTVPMPFPEEDITLRGPDDAILNRELSRKESARSQNAVSPSLNNAPSDPTAHINVESGTFVQFEVSSTRTAGNQRRREMPREKAIARPVLKQSVDVKTGGDGVSPTGIAHGLFSDGCVQGEGHAEAR